MDCLDSIRRPTEIIYFYFKLTRYMLFIVRKKFHWENEIRTQNTSKSYRDKTR